MNLQNKESRDNNLSYFWIISISENNFKHVEVFFFGYVCVCVVCVCVVCVCVCVRVCVCGMCVCACAHHFFFRMVGIETMYSNVNLCAHFESTIQFKLESYSA